MKRMPFVISGSLLLSSALAFAQQGPESLLPPGFDKPAVKAPPPRAADPPATTSPRSASSPVVQPLPGASAPMAGSPAAGPSLERLQNLTPEQLEAMLSSKSRVDMPPGARRAMKQVGIINEAENGMPAWSLANQHPALVRAVLAGNKGQVISRWGHILLRRALASRLDAPKGMGPAEFNALRTALLVRMGESAAARGLAQDIDVGNYNPAMMQAAIDAYVATGDLTGTCPAVTWHGGLRKDKQWQVLQAICTSFSSGGTRGMAQLDRVSPGDGIEKIDLMLAQKYAGAAGRGQRAVTIEWDDVTGMTPWRYGLTLAVGLEPPTNLVSKAGPWLSAAAATAPMASFATRAAGSDVAGAAGVLSSAAMVDLYSQIYALGGTGEWTDRAVQLQAAYLATDPADRLNAIKALWGDGSDPAQYYSRQVLTAYAAARLPVTAEYAADAAGLIASMLAAGLDENALKWGSVAPNGSEAWALLALAQPARSSAVSSDQIDSFHDEDGSIDQRKTRFLVAGLAGLGRLPVNSANELAGKYGFEFGQTSRWTRLIDGAAEVGNPELVALLAGLGMQGSGWDKMTARNLYHIVAALSRVGLADEARMIAAEAVARG